jgi:hypothetical protein
VDVRQTADTASPYSFQTLISSKTFAFNHVACELLFQKTNKQFPAHVRHKLQSIRDELAFFIHSGVFARQSALRQEHP